MATLCVLMLPVCLVSQTPTPAADDETLLLQLRRWVSAAVHLAKLMALALPLAASAPLVVAGRTLVPSLEDRWWQLAYWLAQRSSPAVMKFLQWASTRRDMFPAAFCDRFEQFHEHAPVHSWSQTEETLAAALGDDWSRMLELDREPIGSGCIAQVYRGKLRATGEDVAVKVIHPQVKRLVALDLQLMAAFVRLLEAVPRLRWLGGKDSVDEFANIMNRQLNLRAEAENLEQFAEHFQGRKGGLRFPTPHMEFTTESVLVESFEDGLHFHEIFSQLDPSRRKAAARVVLESYLRMVFLDNFAHGDLHPGNLLFEAQPPINAVSRPSVSRTGAGVVAVDAGIVTKLEPEDLRNFVELFHAVATGDGYKAGELIVSRSKPNKEKVQATTQTQEQALRSTPSARSSLSPQSAMTAMATSAEVIPMTAKCTNVESFCEGMEKIVSEALHWRLSLQKVHVGALLRQVMELCCSHEVQLEGKYASIVVSIAVLEAVGRKLDPDIDLLAVALPIIAQSLVKNVLN